MIIPRIDGYFVHYGKENATVERRAPF